MRTVIVNGLVAHADGARREELAFENGVITELGAALSRAGSEVVDAGGRIVMPGGVDVHTHVALTNGDVTVSDGFYAGTLAALMGGTTTIVEHPSDGPAGCSLFHMPETFRNMAREEAVADYGIHAVLQHVDAAVLDEAPRLMADGCPSFKAYLTYDTRLDDEALLRIMACLGRHGGLLAVHAESHPILAFLQAALRREGRLSPPAHPLSRPDFCEAEAVGRLIALSRAAQVLLYIVHLSTREGLAHIERAQERGLPVLAETCPQYLLLTDDLYAGRRDAAGRPLPPAPCGTGGTAAGTAGPEEVNKAGAATLEGLKYVMSPPLRAAADAEALWDGLRRGAVSVVATDHCSFSLAQKWRLGRDDVFACPGGIPGIETRIPLLYSEGVGKGRLTLERFVDVVSTSPARIMGLRRKGRLDPGMDADIVILDPHAERTLSTPALHQQVDYTPFSGLRVRGWPAQVWLRGMPAVVDGEFAGRKGMGRFVPRFLH